ncbi:glycosyltransferase [Candidatus Neomarinimicrobiota bacterium]
MMKLYIVPSWYPSRLNPINGTFFAEWAQMLADSGIDVTVITNLVHPFKAWPGFRQLPPRVKKAQLEHGLRTYRREAINPFPRLESLTFRYYRRRLIRQFEIVLEEQGIPDALLIHSSLWAGAALSEWMQSTSIPCIIVEHMKAFLLDRGFTPFQMGAIRRAYQGADKVVAVSTALETRIKQLFPVIRDKTTVIHNPLAIADSTMNRSLSKETPFTFISVAYLRPEKRVDILLRAFAELRGGGHETTLRLVGDGPLRSPLEKLARELGLHDSVIFLGNLDRQAMKEELLRSHCLVLSSEVETFGLALVEALACGLTVISTRCGGPQDIVTEEAGILVPVNDPAALGHAMAGMIKNASTYNPVRLNEYARRYFSPQVYVSRLNTLISDLVPAS